jgi:hypothetical protein
MSQQEPTFYNLKFSGDAPFWAGAEELTRRTFLMPLSNPAEFLAFGVVGPSSTVLFVARGRVREDLGRFLATMAQAGASTELYKRVPLPWPLVKRYTSDDPYGGPETEGPRDPPVTGVLVYGGGADPSLAGTSQDLVQSPEWPAEEDFFSARQVFVLPLAGGEDFLALGVCREPDRFVFVARGRVGTQREDFIARMQQAGVHVEPCDWPPLDFLQQFVNQHYTGAFTPVIFTNTQQPAPRH